MTLAFAAGNMAVIDKTRQDTDIDIDMVVVVVAWLLCGGGGVLVCACFALLSPTRNRMPEANPSLSMHRQYATGNALSGYGPATLTHHILSLVMRGKDSTSCRIVSCDRTKQ